MAYNQPQLMTRTGKNTHIFKNRCTGASSDYTETYGFQGNQSYISLTCQLVGIRVSLRPPEGKHTQRLFLLTTVSGVKSSLSTTGI